MDKTTFWYNSAVYNLFQYVNWFDRKKSPQAISHHYGHSEKEGVFCSDYDPSDHK